MIDHPNHPPHNPQTESVRLPPPENAILMVLSESPTFPTCPQIVAASGDYPPPYQISLAAVRRCMPDLRRRKLVERVPNHGGFRITPLGELAKHAI